MESSVAWFTSQEKSRGTRLDFKTSFLKSKQGVNTYAYVGGNPLRYSDPSRECPWCIGAVIGGISGAIGAGNSVGWSWNNGWKIAGGALVGAVAGGATGGLSIFGNGAVNTVASNFYIGAASGFLGNIASQKVIQPECSIDFRQAAFQGMIGGFSGLATVVAYAPYAVPFAAQWAAGISGVAGLGVNSLYSTNLGGFANPSLPYLPQ